MENEDNSPVATNPALILARRLQENKNSLHISRVPKKTRDTFIAIAEEEFCSDYGMLLKFLMDKAIDYDMKAMITKIQEHEERIVVLEQGKEDSTPVIRTLGGKTIKKEDKK